MTRTAQASRDSIRRHSKSFSLASRLLPEEARDRAIAVYAWCRRADDAIDLVSPDSQAPALDALHGELREIDAGGSFDDPVLDSFQRTVLDTGIPIAYAEDLLAGLRMDVGEHRYQTMESLLEYCYYVAGSVGLMMCHVMGVREEGATRHAAHLGMAMQLTNICRDVQEDWGRGRLYLPDALLAECGARGLADRLGGPFPETAREPVGLAISRLLDEAERYYRSGDAGLPALSWRCAMAIRTARLVYSSIGGRIRRQGCDPLAGRAFVPFGRKLGLMSLAVTASISEVPTRLIRRGTTVPSAPRAILRFPDDLLPL